ncbi:pantoate-beta-alanine ligase [Mycoemilia scoparia]|uniref:Pantoate--beta-alanine ligase n=1 Tax=Mycoemilia scoparia TaxID=417184 RepID=A0A9W7ZNT4_9FUNG|nr:pantoate-beta-alanine ligase [Mycoemilia scoparia]
MRVISKVTELHQWRAKTRSQNKTVGFVPTMGALHQGHFSLVEAAKSKCDVVAVSIFVNPSQFAPHEDYDNYPRDLESDLKKLEPYYQNVQDDDDFIVFAPSVEEMYPRGITLDIERQIGGFVEIRGLSLQLEGVTRPHFFRGVATVVTKLFCAVQPDLAFFGQKDIQQCFVVRALVEDLIMFPMKVVIVPTQRDPKTGLALSSRNVYLTDDERDNLAPMFYKGLKDAVAAYENKNERSAEKLLALVRNRAEKEGGLNIEYISLIEPDTLEPVVGNVGEKGAILCGAWRIGAARLIDNVLLGIPLMPKD